MIFQNDKQLQGFYCGAKNGIAIYRGSKLLWGKVGSDEYTDVSEIVFTGSQYIELDFVPKAGDEIHAAFTRTRLIAHEAVISAGTSTYQLIWLLSKSSNIYVYYKYFTSGGASASNDNQIGALNLDILSNGEAVYGGKTYSEEISKDKGSVNTNLFIGARANGTSYFAGRISAFSVRRGGETVLDLKPKIRNSDGVAGFLDTISGEFYSSNGTSEFSYIA